MKAAEMFKTSSSIYNLHEAKFLKDGRTFNQIDGANAAGYTRSICTQGRPRENSRCNAMLLEDRPLDYVPESHRLHIQSIENSATASLE